MFYQNPYQVLGVYHVHRSPGHVTAANRSHTALAFLLSGESTYQYNHKTMAARAGDLVYVPAGLDYHQQFTNEELIIIHLHGFTPPESDICIEHNLLELTPLFQNLCHQWESGAVAYHNRCTALLYTIFEHLEKLRSTVTPIPSVLEPGIILLQQNFRDPSLTIPQLAQQCHISEVYFRRLYLKHFGKTPHQALLELRFDYACSLLRSGYYETKQIAELAGFSDVKYFRTAFKKHFCMTPTQYLLTNSIHDGSIYVPNGSE